MADDFAAANAGVWTWTLGDGRWSYELKPTAQTCRRATTRHHLRGVLRRPREPGRLHHRDGPSPGECASKTWKADWRETENGLLMDVTTDGDDLDFLFGAETWERID